MKEHEHTSEAIRERLDHGPRTSYLRDWIYGGIDGAVTTFAVVSGVVGARLSTNVILILGVANLLADGFSMAAGNFAGTRAEREEFERLRAMEYRHIRDEPEGEREEVREIFRRKGFEGRDLERIVQVVCSDRDLWVRTMLTDEHGLPHAIRSPLLAGGSTMSAFLVCGFVPLVPFIFGLPRPFELSLVMTAAVFFAIGSAKSRWSVIPWWRSGIETLLIGSAAAGIAYCVGLLFAA
ncbi:MAG TPA: VIT1/CCC1 transporter family protein [Thermoanaerobaculia bacterium]|nr:VIT1/CCC1 transporter family protein [Thermoanaerobaculia bacterium]